MPEQLPDDEETVDVDPAMLEAIRAETARNFARPPGALLDDETVDVDPAVAGGVRSVESGYVYDNDATISVDPAVLDEIRMRSAGPFGATEAPNLAGPPSAALPARPRTELESKAASEWQPAVPPSAAGDSSAGRRKGPSPSAGEPRSGPREVMRRPSQRMDFVERGDPGPWRPPPRLRGEPVARTDHSLMERPSARSGWPRSLVAAVSLAAVAVAVAAILLLLLAFLRGGDSDQDRPVSDPDAAKVEIDGGS